MARSTRTGRRTDYRWNGASGTQGLSAGSASVNDISGSLGAPHTLTRSRGELVVSMDGPSASEQCVVGLGLIVTTEEQLAAGVASIPDVLLDLDAEWIWHGFACMIAQGAVEDQLGMVARFSIDSKAMRRMKQSQNTSLILKNTSLSGTPAIDVVFGVRQLFGN